MELRLDPARGSQDPFSYALVATKEYASTCGHPFAPPELWRALAERGLRFESNGQIVPEGPESLTLGNFTAGLALDHLYTQQSIKRKLGADGNYEYWG
jgi:hypothetical protein